MKTIDPPWLSRQLYELARRFLIWSKEVDSHLLGVDYRYIEYCPLLRVYCFPFEKTVNLLKKARRHTEHLGDKYFLWYSRKKGFKNE